MAIGKGAEDSAIWITGSFSPDGQGIQIRRAVVREGLSRLTETTVEFLFETHEVELSKFLAQRMTIHLSTVQDPPRLFTGTIVSVESLGTRRGLAHFVAELRPHFWMLTKTRDSRVFQQMSTLDIIREVLNKHAITQYRIATGETYAERNYCIQYRESDFDFLCRLMEEEGLYYYFDHADSESKDETLVICDGGGGSHRAVAGDPKLPFIARDQSEARRDDHIAEWGRQEQVTSGRVSLQDFDFEVPGADLSVANKIPKGNHPLKDNELYDYPGSHRKDTALGNRHARVRMEAEAARFDRRRGAGTIRTLATGSTFSIHAAETGEKMEKGEFLITDAVHYLMEEGGFEEVDIRRDLEPVRAGIPEGIHDVHSCVFGAMPAEEPFRVPRTTPWPRIAGLHTATVVGPGGEEIHTDEYGRIKVQFHWDREGKKNDESSCWVRVVTPWSGRNWGMVSVPRIGQEVVVQFEEGDPDRPICTGMLYNDATRPPYKYPEDATQSGLKTNSSKGGGGFNELMFEDAKDKELVRFQAERDYEQIVKNDKTVTIGLEKADPGNLTQTVQNNVTETIKKGDHAFSIETGSQFVDIQTDRTATIVGNDSTTVKQGNKDVTVSLGNLDVAVDTGKITMEAMQSIELKVGSNSIKIDQSGITIKGIMVKIQGSAMAEMKSPMSTVKGTGMLVLKGGLTMIN